jgi:hypothetical protein
MGRRRLYTGEGLEPAGTAQEKRWDICMRFCAVALQFLRAPEETAGSSKKV